MKVRLPSILPCTSQTAGSASRREGFSLVEMMVVLAITSVLTVLTMTSFSSLRTMSLSASGNQMVDVFAMARQNSISKNAYTVVVIKSQGPGAYNAYCLLELTQQDDSGTLGSWTPITPWHNLGSGVVFESGQATDTFTSTPGKLPKPLPTSFSYHGQQIDLTTSAIYQCYMPDGTLSAQVTPPTRMVLRLIQGQVDSSSGAFTYQGATSSGKQVSYYDLVFVGNTGTTKIERP